MNVLVSSDIERFHTLEDKKRQLLCKKEQKEMKKLQKTTSEINVANAKRNELVEKMMVGVSSVGGVLLLLCCIETITDYQSRDVSSQK